MVCRTIKQCLRCHSMHRTPAPRSGKAVGTWCHHQRAQPPHHIPVHALHTPTASCSLRRTQCRTKPTRRQCTPSPNTHSTQHQHTPTFEQGGNRCMPGPAQAQAEREHGELVTELATHSMHSMPVTRSRHGCTRCCVAMPLGAMSRLCPGRGVTPHTQHLSYGPAHRHAARRYCRPCIPAAWGLGATLHWQGSHTTGPSHGLLPAPIGRPPLLQTVEALFHCNTSRNKQQ
jgi:hypothetical protein